MRTLVAQVKSADYHGEYSRSVNCFRREVRNVGDQNGQRYLDGAVVDMLVDSLYDHADYQSEHHSHQRQIEQPQETCAYRGRLPAYHHRDTKFQRQQSCSIVHQALSFEDVYDALGQSDALRN